MTKIARERPAPGHAVGTAKCPRLPAYLYRVDPKYCVVDDDTWGLRVWCGWCDAWHYHGAGAKDDPNYPLYGGRAAHCHSASPYKRTGYVLTDPKKLERAG